MRFLKKKVNNITDIDIINDYLYEMECELANSKNLIRVALENYFEALISEDWHKIPVEASAAEHFVSSRDCIHSLLSSVWDKVSIVEKQLNELNEKLCQTKEQDERNI